MSPDGRRRALGGMLAGRPPFSYNPLRKNLGDLLNMQFRMFPSEDVPLAVVLEQVARAAKSEKERSANLEVAKLLYEGLRAEKFKASHEEFHRLSLGPGLSATYCSDLVLARAEDLVVSGFNFRRTPLVGSGAKFAFSVMHEQSRALNEDLREARLALVQFPHPKRASRHISISYSDEGSLFTYDQLALMTAETYRVWYELQEAAEYEARRSGTDDKSWWGGGD